MADLIKQHFRATNGLDAAGEKVINVAKADYSILDDAVNVEFFIEENTIQKYDTTRGYKSGFAVMYDGRIWVSNRAVASPAGAFQPTYWDALRTDPKWEYINASGKQLLSGDFISADTTSADLVFTLPANPQDGDTICIRDVAGNTGYKSITVNASNQRMTWNKTQVTTMNITHPYSQVYYIFSNRLWQTFVTDHEKVGKIVSNSAGTYQASASDEIYARFTTSGPLTITLPKFMNQGDVIFLKDLDGKEASNHIIVNCFSSDSSVGSIGTTSMEIRTSGEASLIWDATDKLWRFWNGDIRQRLRVIKDDVTLVANESVMVFGANNSTIKTININLPINIQPGDNVRIALNYMRKGQTVVISAATGSTIATNKTMIQFPRRSEYPPADTWVQVQTLTINGTDDYPPIIEFAYVEDSATSKYWVVADISPRVERVDASNRDRLGVIALATQAQANVDKGSNPSAELAITPESLANRTALETRQGIAALATTAQVNQVSTATYDDLTIVTPKKLNERTATETRRGLAEIATQAETNGGTDDITIITPLKLETRRATETMAGIAPIVTNGGTKPTLRNSPGTGIYNYNDNSNIVTPKGLREIKSSYLAQGTIFLATEAEVIAGTAYDATYPVAVTPQELHKKTATEDRIGFTRTATQTEVNTGTDDFKYVTPLKLNTRKAIETLDGIIRIGTQAEFDAGALDNVASTPLKIKTFLSRTARTSVTADSGLVQSGSLWTTLALNIQASSETQRGTARLATQTEVNTGTDDATIVTPLKLMQKKATESAEGIIRVAAQAETVAGTSAVLSVSPKNLKYVVQQESTWEASPTLRGFVKISENSITFVGNDTAGNTQDLSLYVKTGYAISPYELNKTLANYLPLKATAVNSAQLGGQTPDKYIRRDIDQTVLGNINFNAKLVLADTLVSTSSGQFNTLTAITSGTIGNSTAAATFNINGRLNTWVQTAGDDAGTLTFKGNGAFIATLYNTGDLSVSRNITAQNLVFANTGVVVNSIPAITPSGTNTVFGSITNDTIINTANANALVVTDTAGSYNLISKKNHIAELSNDFTRRNAASSIVGPWTFTTPTLQAQSGTINAAYINSTAGNFVVEVTTAAVYNTLPGYVVPTYGENEIGNPVVVSYTQVNGPGTLTQTATETGKYQMWAPRPATTGDNISSQTFWMRNWSTATSAWDAWGRVYTSNNPPTPSEIGAASTSGSAFNDLKIRDYLQVGNVRIRPDNDLKTVVFEWIDS